MFRFALEPFFFEKAKDRDAELVYARVMKYFVIYGWIIFLGINLFLHIIKWIIPLSYQDALGVVPIITAGYLLYGVFVNLSVWYKINDITKYGAYLTMAGAVITIVINVGLIPVYGYYASAWAHVACYTVMVILSYIAGRSIYPVPYDMKNIFRYSALALGLFMIWKWLNIQNMVWGTLVSLLFMGLFMAYAEKKDHIFGIMKRRKMNKTRIKLSTIQNTLCLNTARHCRPALISGQISTILLF
jgi:O-antigen/teichoic acid export membrane protein